MENVRLEVLLLFLTLFIQSQEALRCICLHLCHLVMACGYSLVGKVTLLIGGLNNVRSCVLYYFFREFLMYESRIVKTYWYSRRSGLFGECEIPYSSFIISEQHGIPNDTQVYVSSSQEFVGRWYYITPSRSLMVVNVERCKELRAFLLLQGIPCS